MPATALRPTAMTTTSGVGWVVRDRAGRVVLICSGADAAAEAATWAERGYRVDTVGLRELIS
jgi:hypothetical protein